MPNIIQRVLEAMRSFHDWKAQRKWVTDQEQARIERAEIEAERAAKREAAKRYAEDRRGNPTEGEIQQEVEKLEQQNSGTDLFGGGGGDGGDGGLNVLDTDREPQMPDALGSNDADDDRGPRLGP